MTTALVFFWLGVLGVCAIVSYALGKRAWRTEKTEAPCAALVRCHTCSAEVPTWFVQEIRYDLVMGAFGGEFRDSPSPLVMCFVCLKRCDEYPEDGSPEEQARMAENEAQLRAKRTALARIDVTFDSGRCGRMWFSSTTTTPPTAYTLHGQPDPTFDEEEDAERARALRQWLAGSVVRVQVLAHSDPGLFAAYLLDPEGDPEGEGADAGMLFACTLATPEAVKTMLAREPYVVEGFLTQVAPVGHGAQANGFAPALCDWASRNFPDLAALPEFRVTMALEKTDA